MSTIDIILIISGSILMLLGFLGSIIPFLPGVTLSYGGILFFYFTESTPFTKNFLLFWLIAIIIIHLLDILVPYLTTKKYGGSRYGYLGGRVGLFGGLFLAPMGIVIGPILGGILSELIFGKNPTDAIRSGFGAFLGFMIAAILKVSVAAILIYYYIEALIRVF